MVIKTKKNGIYTLFLILTFSFISIIVLSPFFFMLLSSFKSGSEIMRHGISLQMDFNTMSLNSYKAIFAENFRYLHWFKSSLIIVLLYTTISLFLSSLVGYGLAVYNFKGKNLLFFLVLLVMMIPLEILLLPMFRLTINLKLINTYMGVVLPFAASPFAIFFFRQYIKGLPKEIIEAARVDGCSEFKIFFTIIVPLMKPAIGAMTILQAMRSWNNFVWPLIVLRTEEKLTIPVGLSSLMTPYSSNYDLLMPGAVVSVIPIAIIFFLNQRAFIEGLTAGGIKQ